VRAPLGPLTRGHVLNPANVTATAVTFGTIRHVSIEVPGQL
jgi:hypothetical protein